MVSGIRALTGRCHCSFRPADCPKPTPRSVHKFCQEDVIVIIPILKVILILIRSHFRRFRLFPQNSDWLVVFATPVSRVPRGSSCLGHFSSASVAVWRLELPLPSSSSRVGWSLSTTGLGSTSRSFLSSLKSFAVVTASSDTFIVGWFLPCFVLQY